MMKRLACYALIALAVCAALPAQTQSLTELRTQLQAALQRNLGRSLLAGALPHVDLQTGAVTRYYPTENHEMILRMGEVYVMCATLVNDDGDEVPVDYYLTESSGRYAVIRREINNRAPLHALMESGRAIRLD